MTGVYIMRLSASWFTSGSVLGR